MSTAPTRTRTRAAKPADAPTSVVAEDVTLDLDTLERENPAQPFTFLHQGRRYTLHDPETMDWQKQMRAFSDPVYFLQNNMSPDDVEAFFAAETPAWKMNAIMEAFRKHFGMPTLGE